MARENVGASCFIAAVGCRRPPRHAPTSVSWRSGASGKGAHAVDTKSTFFWPVQNKRALLLAAVKGLNNRQHETHRGGPSRPVAPDCPTPHTTWPATTMWSLPAETWDIVSLFANVFLKAFPGARTRANVGKENNVAAYINQSSVLVCDHLCQSVNVLIGYPKE